MQSEPATTSTYFENLNRICGTRESLLDSRYPRTAHELNYCFFIFFQILMKGYKGNF